MLPLNRTLPDADGLRRRVLHFTFSQPWAMFLDSCGYSGDKHSVYDWIAAGSSIRPEQAYLTAAELVSAKPGWKFGVITYEARTYTEPRLSSLLPKTISFPEVFFFEPEWVIAKPRGSKEILIYGKADFEDFDWEDKEPDVLLHSEFISNFHFNEYCDAVNRIREHIREGDFYEMNFCRDFSASASLSNPLALWEKLISLSPMPFSALLRKEDTWILSASPERFLQLKEDRLITEPIKGTIRRDPAISDDVLKARLASSEKDKAENVMITDLSRNDLNRSCVPGSVRVPSLFEVRGFPGLFHMLSTIEGRLLSDTSGLEALFRAFPPGSMTGAPKFRVMELTEQIERSARGVFSGSAGYFEPSGNFDLNVVIRTLIWDKALGKLSFHAGGAITWDSDPAAEFEETQTKAAALFRLLGIEKAI